ncbi:MAG: hypothetical protein ACTSXX_11385 [Candidatus Baldrarchaeia archaeon]
MNDEDLVIRIIHAMPSVNIFYPDATFSYTEAIREYDALLLLKVVRKARGRTESEYYPILIEFAGKLHEASKLMVDRLLNNPQVVICGSQELCSQMREMLSFHHFILSDLGFLEKKLDDFAKKFIEVYKHVAEHLNLFWFSLISLSVNNFRKILGDFARLSNGNLYLDYLSELGRLYKSVLDREENIELVLEDLSRIVEKIEANQKSTSELTRKIDRFLQKVKKSKQKRLTIMIYPQSIFIPKNIKDTSDTSILRLKNMIKILKMLIDAIKNTDGIEYVDALIMSNRRIENLCNILAKELCGLIDTKTAYIDENEDPLVNTLKGLITTDGDINLLVVVLQDYKKDLFGKSLRKIVEDLNNKGKGANLALIIIPEAVFTTSRGEQTKRIIVVSGNFLTGISARYSDKLDIKSMMELMYPHVLWLDTDDLYFIIKAKIVW